MTKDLKKMTVDSLIKELHKQFIDSNSYIQENSIFANELLKRDEDLVINEIGRHLQSTYENIKRLPYQDQMEVQQGWTYFTIRVAKDNNINIDKKSIDDFNQLIEWLINYS